MLKVFGIDSVIFTKMDELKYSIEFAELGTYERFYGMESEVDEDNSNINHNILYNDFSSSKVDIIKVADITTPYITRNEEK